MANDKTERHKERTIHAIPFLSLGLYLNKKGSKVIKLSKEQSLKIINRIMRKKNPNSLDEVLLGEATKLKKSGKILGNIIRAGGRTVLVLNSGLMGYDITSLIVDNTEYGELLKINAEELFTNLYVFQAIDYWKDKFDGDRSSGKDNISNESRNISSTSSGASAQ